MNGLLKIKSAAELVQEEKKKADSAAEQANEYAIQTNLASYIKKIWEQNRWAKQEVYRRLLYCLRARKGVYSDQELNSIKEMGGADPIYLKLTGTKSRAASAWIRDILLPIKDRPWELNPTPIPELPEDVKEATLRSVITQIQQMVQQDGLQLTPDQQLQFTDMVKSKVLDQLTSIAEIAVKNVERKIEDMMVDGGFKKALEEFIEDFVTYPFAVLKGPYYQSKVYLEWKNGEPVPTTQNLLCWRRVSPFDIYYSPYTNTIQDGNLIERIRYSKEQLYQLKGMPGYKDKEISKVLYQYEANGLKDWIWEDFERDTLEKNSQFFWSDENTIDGLHFWGHVQGQDLLDWGYRGDDVNDPLKMYPVDAILIDRCVIRAVINKNPMGQRPYHSACWDAIPGSLVGVALPEQMEDHQKMVNATARALATNMSIGSGPQVALLADMLAPGESMTGIYPMKIWQMRSSITGNSGKPIEFFQPEIKAQELLAVLNQFETKADDVTNVPRYSYGNEKIGGAGSTATGLSMLMNSAAKGIRRAIANIDLGIIQPTVYQTFLEIMMKDPDPTIRGDVKVVARGSAAVLIKEQTQENQKEFLQITSNPFDIEIIGKKGRARLLANIANSLDIDPLVLPTDEELELREQQEREMMQRQAEAEMAAKAGGGDAAAVQQQAMELQAAEQQLEQRTKQIDQVEAAVDMKDNLVKKQASDVQSEIKKLKKAQEQIEASMAQLAMERIEQEKQKAQTIADIEKARIKLEMEAEKLKALADKTKLISATKEEETDKEGKPSEKKEAKEMSAETSKAISEALSQVAEALKVSKSPKKISIERDNKGKITGAVLNSVNKERKE